MFSSLAASGGNTRAASHPILSKKSHLIYREQD